MLLTDAIEIYLEWKAGHTRQAAETYKVHLGRFAKYVKKELENVRIEDIARFQHALYIKYAPANAAYCTVVLKNFFEFWRRQGTACIDPWLLKIPKYRNRPHAAVLPEEYEALNSSCMTDEFWELQKKVVLQILWFTGIRLSELCDLDISDVDIVNGRALIATKKNTSQRWIFWPQDTNDLLKRYLGIRVCLNQRPALFIAQEGYGSRDRISGRTVQRWIKELAARINLTKKISPHSFRHGRAHRILEMGGNVVEIQKCLGHSPTNPVASFAYIHLSPTEIEPRLRKRF